MGHVVALCHEHGSPDRTWHSVLLPSPDMSSHEKGRLQSLSAHSSSVAWTHTGGSPAVMQGTALKHSPPHQQQPSASQMGPTLVSRHVIARQVLYCSPVETFCVSHMQNAASPHIVSFSRQHASVGVVMPYTTRE
jgi:hypothetical protein